MESSAYCRASLLFFCRFCQKRKAQIAKVQAQTMASIVYEWRLEGMEEGEPPHTVRKASLLFNGNE